MKVFVSGAEGFIGSHVVEELVRQGRPVRALVQYNSFGSIGWLSQLAADVRQSVEIVFGDVRDETALFGSMDGCDEVLHLAALISIPFSYSNPSAYIQTNVVGTLNMLEAARRADVRRFVQTSTSEVYGSALTVPMTEEHRLNAQSPYAASKIASDQLALSYFSSFGLPIVVLRPFNTYGPRQSERAVISRLIRQLETSPSVVLVGNSEPTRDFTFVRDTARGFLSALIAPNVVGEVINLGSGFEISIGEVVELLMVLFESDAVVRQDSELVRPIGSEVNRLFADATKARQLLGWEPSLVGKDGFRSGLEETIAWFRDNPRGDFGDATFI